MSENLDPVIGRVLGELRKAGDKGLSITELAKLLDADTDAKNTIWETLINRKDVRFVDESKSPLQILSLTNLLGVGQGDVRLRIVSENGHEVPPAREALVTSTESDPHLTVDRKEMQRENGSSEQTKQQPNPPQPAPKRRGRPPKAKKAAVASSSLPSQERPLSTHTPVASTSRATRRQSRATIPLNHQPNPTSTDSDTIVVEPILGNGKINTHVREQEDTLKSITLTATDTLPADTVPSASEPPPVHQNTPQSTINGFSQDGLLADPVAATPTPPSHLPQSPAPLDRSNIQDTSPLEPTPRASKPGDNVEAAESSTQRRSSSRFSAGELLPEATFTSQADMDWEDGKDGVYVNPPGVKAKKAPGFKKKKHSTLVVFRSSKLKDPERLVNGTDTWRERIMPVVAQARVAFDDDAVEEGLIPRLNKKRKPEAQPDSTPNQKAAKKRLTELGEVDPSLAQGWGEAYPDDDYDSDYSDISILEADVPNAPADPNSWSSSWTREGAEQAKLNADYMCANFEDRASSFTPSDSQTPWGSPAPPNLGDTALSPTVADSGMRSMAQRASQPPSLGELIGSHSHATHQNSFTTTKKSVTSYPVFVTSPDRPYKSPYAPIERESSPSRTSGNGQSMQPSISSSQTSKGNSDGSHQLQKALLASFSTPTEHEATLPTSAAHQLQSPLGSTRHVAALNPLQSTDSVPTYRSPYSAPALATAVRVESPFVVGQQHHATPSHFQQDRMNQAPNSFSMQNAVKTPLNEPQDLERPLPKGQDTAQSMGSPTLGMGATPDEGPARSVDYNAETEEFLSFMDKNLSTPSSGTLGRGRGRGKYSARGAVRGRGCRRGARGGARGEAHATSTTPLVTVPDQVAVQGHGLIDPAISTLITPGSQIPESPQIPANNMLLSDMSAQELEQANGNVTGALGRLRTTAMNGPYTVSPEDVFSRNPVADQAPEDVPMTDSGNPTILEPSTISATNGDLADLSVAAGMDNSLHQTPGLASDADFNLLETPQITPSQSSTRGARSAKSKAKPTPRPTPTSKTPRVRVDPEEKLRARIVEAEVVQVPDGATRLSCIYKDLVGNMILSHDQSVLEFFALSQHPPEMPMVSMKISKIIGNPIMSIKGSFPMELHVKSSNDENKKKGYRFTYAASGSGSAAAQSMRTKIVTAMIASEFTAGDYATVAEAQAAKVRPYLCELCGDRFKNPNGLEYHLTKAKSKCNPNWVPDADTGRRPYKKKTSKKARAASREGTPRTPRKRAAAARNEASPEDNDDLAGSSTSEDEPVLIPRSARKVTVDRVYESDGSEAPRSARPARKTKPVEEEDADADGDSDDSIFNWARNNATTGYKATKTRRSASRDDSQTPRPRSARKSKSTQVGDQDADGDSDTSLVEWFEKHGKISSKVLEAPKLAKTYKALHREAEVADQIVRDFANRIRDGEEEISGLAISPTSQLTTANDIATDMTCKELNSKWYEEVVTNLVQRNEGMFPAEKSVWFASVAIWLKQQPITAVLPESKLCAKAVDELVESKKFTRVEFEFKDRNRNPRAITRSILTTMGLNMRTERADLIKELVQESHPKSYVPSQLAPPPSVLEKLQAVVARLLPSLTVTADDQEEEGESSPVLEFGDDSDEDDFEMDVQAAETESQASDSDSDKDLDEEDDAVSALSGAKTSKKRNRTSSGGVKMQRKAGHNAKISEGVRRRFDLIRAGGENPYPWNLKAKKNNLTAAERVKRNEEKRIRDKELAATKQLCWDQAPAFMPNTATGAWDQAPVVLQVARMTSGQSGKHSTRTNYGRHQRLPEPITFMQAPDGAWSVRPFGHGVKPIHSRPARRAEGNPNLQKYLDRVENSHRPIIYPPVHNRVNLPSVPSIRLLEAMRSGKPIDETTGLPIVNLSARKKRRASAVSFDDEEGPAPKRNRHGTSVRFAEADDTDEYAFPVKISRATGKPTRKYSRNFPKQVFVSSMNDPKISGERSRILPSRKSGRKPKFSEVDILNFYEPKKLTGDVPKNPGLDTLPASFGLSAPNAEDVISYSPNYNNLVFIAASPIDEDQEPGLSSWTVNRLDVYRPADYNFRWDDATAFTVENLPFSDLKEDYGWIPTYNADPEVVDLNSDVGMEVEVVEKPKRKRQRTTSSQGKQVKADKYSYVRQHTALPQDFVDLFDDPAAAGKFFGVEIGVPNESTLKRSRNLGSNVMLPEVESRFSVACMVIRVLAGGLDLQVDWILVAQLFPDYSLNFLKKVWNGILTRKKSAILKLEDDFRDKFLAAYQTGEIPRIDYEHLAEYAWGDLVDWVMTNTNSSLSNKTIMLPPTREEVADEFELRETNDEGCPWRENYFSITTAVYKRIMASSSVPHSIPLQPRKRRHVEDIDDFTVARSWVRVAAITPNEDWDRQLAKAKLSSFSKSMLAEVLNSLVTQKVVKKRALNKAKNGRVYEIHDTWSVTLRRHMKETQFVEAANFKRWMDAQFRSGMQCIKADYFANEGTIVCLTSLQAHGRIRFHGPNIPMNKFGLGDGGYETKKIPRERLRFNIDIYPTSSYIYDDGNPVLSNVMFRDPPRGGENGEIPIWYGLTEKPIWRIWYRILAAVGQVVALRSGVTIQGLKESFRSTLEEWEWNLLMQWGSEVGLFHSLGEDLGASEGWTVGEWWWAVIGAGFVDIGGEAGVEGEGVRMDALMG